MPRTLTGNMAERGAPPFPLAALLVNVTARMPPGVAWPVASSQAMRVVSTGSCRARARQDERVARRQRHRSELLGIQVGQRGDAAEGAPEIGSCGNMRRL